MKKFIQILILTFFFILPIFLWFFVSSLANTMRWKLGSPLVAGYNWMRWSHLYLAGGSFFCLLLYIPVVLSVVKKKTAILLVPFLAAAGFFVFSIYFAQKGQTVYALQRIEEMDKEIKKNPNDSIPLENKAIAFEKIGEYDKAIALYTLALEKSKRPAYVLHDRGLARDANKEYDEAIQDFTKALEMNPAEQKFVAQCHNDRGVAYFHSGQYEQSLEDVKKAIELGYRVHPGFLSALEKKEYRV